MKIKAKKDLRNSYGEVLFIAGKVYDVEEEDNRRVWVNNESGWPSMVRRADLDADFEEVKEKTQFEKDCEMQFEIIPLSASHAEYRNKGDKKWIGFIPGVVNGWQFEYVNKDGKYEYGSAFYISGTAEDEVKLYEGYVGSWRFDTPRSRGFEPTGRVVFRGYATEYYDAEEREWFVRDYEPTAEMAYIAR